MSDFSKIFSRYGRLWWWDFDPSSNEQWVAMITELTLDLAEGTGTLVIDKGQEERVREYVALELLGKRPRLRASFDVETFSTDDTGVTTVSAYIVLPTLKDYVDDPRSVSSADLPFRWFALEANREF